MEQLPPFPGFRREAFDFLRGLKANNERDWFKARKQTFDDELIWPLRCLVADLSRRFGGTDIPLKGDPSNALFRIYRDVRFSKNKDPYKTHVAAVLSRTGSKKESGGLYIHIEPGGSFVVAGFWQPEKELIRSWRERIVSDPSGIREVMEKMSDGGFELLDHGGVLKRPPRGFQDVEDEDLLEILKHKSLLVSRPFDEEVLSTPEFADAVVSTTREMQPLLDWGWRIQDDLTRA